MPEPKDYDALRDGLIAETDAMRTIAGAVGRLGAQIEELMASLPPETREALLKQAVQEAVAKDTDL